MRTIWSYIFMGDIFMGILPNLYKKNKKQNLNTQFWEIQIS